MEEFRQQLAKRPDRKARLIRALYKELREMLGIKVFEDTRHCQENMKSRCREEYAILDPRFNEFPDFLWHMGPCPFAGASIHRKDNDLGYSPGNCEWADKKTQSRHRRNTVRLTYKGETLPLTVWAERLNIPAHILRARKAKGWTDEQVIEGRNDDGLLRDPIDAPWPPDEAEDWERRFREDGGRNHFDRCRYLAMHLGPIASDLYKRLLDFAYWTRQKRKAEIQKLEIRAGGNRSWKTRHLARSAVPMRSPEDEAEYQRLRDSWAYYEGYVSKAHAYLLQVAEEGRKKKAALARRKLVFPYYYDKKRSARPSNDDDEYTDFR